jgi:uncharacterized membrane protein YqjE
MANEVQTASEPSMTGLVAGIIKDFGDLIREEIRFAKVEVRADLSKTKEAALVLALGAGLAVLGILLFAVMLVFLLHWLTVPNSVSAAYDPGVIPLWGCFGIVSAIFLAIGAGLSWMGYKKFESFNPLPDQTAQTVKENVEWLTNSK